jgi:hypothetical protein
MGQQLWLRSLNKIDVNRMPSPSQADCSIFCLVVAVAVIIANVKGSIFGDQENENDSQQSSLVLSCVHRNEMNTRVSCSEDNDIASGDVARV